MPKLLVVDVSPRGQISVSRRLSSEFAATWQDRHPDGKIVMRDLQQTLLPYLDADWVAGAFIPADQRSEAMNAALAVGNELIGELRAVDHILISTPMYNFTVPAILKSYIDHIVRMGETVSSDYEGMLLNKKVTIALASGGDFSPGARLESLNFASGYLRHVLGFIGLKDVEIVLAGGTGALAAGKVTMDDFRTGLLPALRAAAAM